MTSLRFLLPEFSLHSRRFVFAGLSENGKKELKPLAETLVDYKKSVAEKQKDQKMALRFDANQLADLEKKWTDLYRQEVKDPKTCDEKIAKLRTTLAPFYEAVRGIPDAAVQIEKVAIDELTKEVLGSTTLEDFVEAGIDVDKRKKFYEAVVQDVEERVPDFYGNDGTPLEKATNTLRQRIVGFLVGVKMAGNDNLYASALDDIVRRYEAHTGDRFHPDDLKNLKLSRDHTTQDLEYVRQWWLYGKDDKGNKNDSNGLDKNGISIPGYENDSYLATLLMGAELMFESQGAEPKYKQRDSQGKDYYDYYKESLIAQLKRPDVLEKIQFYRGLIEAQKPEAKKDPEGLKSWESNVRGAYANLRDVIYSTVPTPEEWLKAKTQFEEAQKAAAPEVAAPVPPSPESFRDSAPGAPDPARMAAGNPPGGPSSGAPMAPNQSGDAIDTRPPQPHLAEARASRAEFVQDGMEYFDGKAVKFVTGPLKNFLDSSSDMSIASPDTLAAYFSQDLVALVKAVQARDWNKIDSALYARATTDFPQSAGKYLGDRMKRTFDFLAKISKDVDPTQKDAFQNTVRNKMSAVFQIQDFRGGDLFQIYSSALQKVNGVFPGVTVDTAAAYNKNFDAFEKWALNGADGKPALLDYLRKDEKHPSTRERMESFQKLSAYVLQPYRAFAFSRDAFWKGATRMGIIGKFPQFAKTEAFVKKIGGPNKINALDTVYEKMPSQEDVAAMQSEIFTETQIFLAEYKGGLDRRWKNMFGNAITDEQIEKSQTVKDYAKKRLAENPKLNFKTDAGVKQLNDLLIDAADSNKFYGGLYNTFFFSSGMMAYFTPQLTGFAQTDEHLAAVENFFEKAGVYKAPVPAMTLPGAPGMPVTPTQTIDGKTVTGRATGGTEKPSKVKKTPDEIKADRDAKRAAAKEAAEKRREDIKANPEKYFTHNTNTGVITFKDKADDVLRMNDVMKQANGKMLFVFPAGDLSKGRVAQWQDGGNEKDQNGKGGEFRYTDDSRAKVFNNYVVLQGNSYTDILDRYGAMRTGTGTDRKVTNDVLSAGKKMPNDSKEAMTYVQDFYAKVKAHAERLGSGADSKLAYDLTVQHLLKLEEKIRAEFARKEDLSQIMGAENSDNTGAFFIDLGGTKIHMSLLNTGTSDLPKYEMIDRGVHIWHSEDIQKLAWDFGNPEIPKIQFASGNEGGDTEENTPATPSPTEAKRSGGTEAAAEDTTKRTFIRTILDARYADQGKRWYTLFPAIVQSVRALNGMADNAAVDIAAVDTLANSVGAKQDFAVIRERFQDYLKYQGA